MTVTAYATEDALRDFLRDQLTGYPGQLELALTAATQMIDNWTGRTFFKSATATAKILRANKCDLIFTPDIATTTGLILATDADCDGVFETTWSASDYQAEPLGGTRPIESLRAIGGRSFPIYRRRALVSLTAFWGFPAVPAPVVQACLLLAGDLARAKDAGSRVLVPGMSGSSSTSTGGFFPGGRVAIELGNELAEALLAPLRVVVVG